MLPSRASMVLGVAGAEVDLAVEAGAPLLRGRRARDLPEADVAVVEDAGGPHRAGAAGLEVVTQRVLDLIPEHPETLLDRLGVVAPLLNPDGDGEPVVLLAAKRRGAILPRLRAVGLPQEDHLGGEVLVTGGARPGDAGVGERGPVGEQGDE